MKTSERDLYKVIATAGIGLGLLALFAALESFISGEARIPVTSRTRRGMRGEAYATSDGDMFFYWMIALLYGSASITFLTLGYLSLKKLRKKS